MSKGRKSRRVINKYKGRPLISTKKIRQEIAATNTPPPFPAKKYTKAKAARFYRKKEQGALYENPHP